jgi:hypothetical protein
LTPREHALRVTALEALSAAVTEEYERARAEAETDFRTAKLDGDRQKDVLLPDGTVIGLISIKEGPSVTTVDDAALLGWVIGRNSEGIEEYFDPSVLDREDVAEVLRAVFPDAVSKRVRKSVRLAYLKQAEATGGWLVDEGSGETVQIAKTAKGDPTGAFAFTDRKPKERRASVMAALRTNRELRAQVLGGALALAAGDDAEAAK